MKRLNIRTEMTDGTVLEVQTALRDYIRYEETAKRQKPPWGGIADNPSRWEAFISWAAYKRTGQYGGTFENFLDEVSMTEATAEEAVDPTQSEVGVD